MLVGRFDGLGRPRIGAVVRIAGLGLRREVQFLVDTGSTTTSLNTDDLTGLDLSGIGPKRPVGVGYGGVLLGYQLPGAAHFEERGVGAYGFQVDMLLVDEPELAGLPSVLGRDILQHWRMVHDPTNEILEFEIWQAHDFVPA